MVRAYIWILMALCSFGWTTSLVAKGACGEYERTALEHWVDEDRDGDGIHCEALCD